MSDNYKYAKSKYWNKLNATWVKGKNILTILLPIGYEHDRIDATWLNTISSFGAARGAVAHTSSKVQQPLDPATLKSTVSYVLSEIKNIDENLKKIT